MLFCWDTYFAACMAAIDNKDLAYANAIEITREKTESGFVPNFANATGCKSRDRSQPPVGSLTVRELYRRYRRPLAAGGGLRRPADLEPLVDRHTAWRDGLLAGAPTPSSRCSDNYWETTGVNERFGGALESGLDNSPMYDDIPFDTQTPPAAAGGRRA